jgi:hypothetical protein
MKKMVPSWCCVEIKRTIVPEQGGVAKEEMDSLFTTRGEVPLELDYAQTYGMGASGAAMVRAAPQWIHHGRLGCLNLPGNNEDTDVQTRDCARFKDRRPLGRKSTANDG